MITTFSSSSMHLHPTNLIFLAFTKKEYFLLLLLVGEEQTALMTLVQMVG
jgi:hypothetical protein